MEQDSTLFVERGDILVRRTGVTHHGDQYDEHGFKILLSMQKDHFWYRGRHRFVLASLKHELSRLDRPPDSLRAIDLGCGCGGWVDYLDRHSSLRWGELALADSSARALEVASTVVGGKSPLFQVDLLDLGWENRWDVIFLLDVLGHIPDDVTVAKQISKCLAPGGLLFLTSPSLMRLWSYNDEVAGHQRRYSVRDLRRLAEQSGLRLVDARYFMFLLSPLLVLYRLVRPDLGKMTSEDIRKLLERTHRVPSKPLNSLLFAMFAAETPLGLSWSFPWGASVLGVFQKPPLDPVSAGMGLLPRA